MKKLLPLLLALATATSPAYPQGEFLIEIDPATGAYTKVGPAIAGIQWVHGHVRAYDEAHGVYVFQGGDPVVDHLYSIDVTDGSILHNPYYPTTNGYVRELQYDQASDAFHGLYWDNGTSQFFMATVDETTGLTTHLCATPIPGLGGTSQGKSAFDDTHQRYLVQQGNQLFSMRPVTGDVVASPVLGLGQGESLMHFWYDTALDTLVGLVQNWNAQTCHLAYINTTTGAVDKKGSGTNYGFGGGSCAIDRVQGRYHHFYTVSGSDYYIATMDITTGNPISNQLVPIAADDNLHSLAYDNNKGKLYAIHWDNDIVTGAEGAAPAMPLELFPQPAHDRAVLQSGGKPLGAVALYNLQGVPVFQTRCTATQLELDLQALPAGVYVVQAGTQSRRIVKQ